MAKQSNRDKRKAKKKKPSPAKKAAPQYPQVTNLEEAPVFFADTVNIGQMVIPGGIYALFTLYQTVLNVKTSKNEFHVSARIQMPIQTAMSMAHILINQLVSSADISREDLQLMSTQTRELLENLEGKLKEKDG